MAFESDFPTHSATGRIIDDLALYGAASPAIEDDPLPEDRDFAGAAAALITHLGDMFDGTPLDRYVEDIGWGLVNVFHRRIERLERDLRDVEAEAKALIHSQDGSEVRSVELERATARARAIADHLGLFEEMQAAMAEEFANVTGSAWRPKSGTRKATALTSAILDAREFIAARRERDQDAKAPQGPIVLFSGGADWLDAGAVFRVLDKVRGQHPDMVLAHTAQEKGADLVAARWAETRKVDQIPCRPDFATFQKAAPFRRNDDMLALKPVLVVTFPGNGITLNLGQKAEKAGVSVIACGIHAQTAAA
jgi:hypothetical protein